MWVRIVACMVTLIAMGCGLLDSESEQPGADTAGQPVATSSPPRTEVTSQTGVPSVPGAIPQTGESVLGRLVRLSEGSGITSVGTITVGGVFCWHQDSDSTERLRFGLFNATGTRTIVQVPHGDVEVPPYTIITSGDLNLDGRKDCRYRFLLMEGELTVTSVPRIIVRDVVGVTLHTPAPESMKLTTRFLQDLLSADLDSMETYVHPEASVDLVQLIARRSTIRPVRVEIDVCSPGFGQAEFLSSDDHVPRASTTVESVKRDADTPSASSTLALIKSYHGTRSASTSPAIIGQPLSADSWSCNLVVRYATQASGPRSGSWELKIEQDLSTGEVLLFPTRP